MTRTPPQHGERRCYLRGCRRPECLDAHYRYMSRLRLERQRGQQRRTDAKPAGDRLRELDAAGWTQAQIERATGVNHRTLGPVLAGTYSTINTSTAERILALPVGPPPTDVDTDATGTIRRLQALVAIGHTYPSIAGRVGIHKDALGIIARGNRSQVRTDTAKAVAAVYRQMSRTPGTSVRSRLHAERLGWHGPLAWDDTTVDDPGAQPDVDEVQQQQPNRNELAAYRREEAAHFAQFGIPAHEIAARLGMAESTVRAIVTELQTGQRRDRSQAAA